MSSPLLVSSAKSNELDGYVRYLRELDVEILWDILVAVHVELRTLDDILAFDFLLLDNTGFFILFKFFFATVE